MAHPKIVRALSLIVLLACISCVSPVDAAKKKKDDGKDAAKQEAEIKAVVDPVDKTLTTLMVKIQSRGLFSPQDAGKLADVKIKLNGLIDQYPTSPLIVKSVFQAGLLFTEREDYMNGYELLSFLAAQFPENPYGLKAKSKILQLEKKLGSDYFPKDEVSAPPPSTATGKAEPPKK